MRCLIAQQIKQVLYNGDDVEWTLKVMRTRLQTAVYPVSQWQPVCLLEWRQGIGRTQMWH